MREQLTDELRRIFSAIAILSPTTIAFAGQVAPPFDAAKQQVPGLSPTQNPMVTQLQMALYQHCYVKKFDGDFQSQPHVPVQPDNLLQLLSESNVSRERWDAGWRIHRILPSGQILAHKDGLVRQLWAGEFVSHEGPGVSPREGANISIFVPRESKTLQPGFYFAFGEAISDQQDEYNVVRLYWHVGGAHIEELVKSITQSLNRYQIPYRLKCPNSLALYKRIDTAVLYISRRFYRVTAEVLTDVHHGLRDKLQPETPLFTRRLAHGLGLAEDPGNGESFGMHRCRIVAEAIWQAYTQGTQTEQARLEQLANQFTGYGLSLERPYLNARSLDQYDLPEWQS